MHQFPFKWDRCHQWNTASFKQTEILLKHYAESYEYGKHKIFQKELSN